MKYKVTLQAKKQLATEEKVNINVCQFGQVPAPQLSFELLKNTVAANSTDEDIFTFDSNVYVPEHMQVRFNLTLQIDKHNAVNVQIRINPDQTVEWRWLAYIGEASGWTTGNTHSTWSDDGNEYLIYMVHEADSTDFWVYIEQVPMVSHLLPAFFPPGEPLPKHLQFNYDELIENDYDNRS